MKSCDLVLVTLKHANTGKFIDIVYTESRLHIDCRQPAPSSIKVYVEYNILLPRKDFYTPAYLNISQLICPTWNQKYLSIDIVTHN
jgi:hypothetical protein